MRKLLLLWYNISIDPEQLNSTKKEEIVFMPKGDYCIYACNGGVACGCCDEEVFVPVLNPFKKKHLDS